jgi:outer membrane protein assembly factor BamB
VVYYGHYCGEFRAVDAATGASLWTKNLDGKDSGHAVLDGVAYVTSIGAAYAFDAVTGATLWTWDPGPPNIGAPVFSNDVIYVHTNDDVLHALDAQTGSELWTVSPGSFPAVTDSMVYVVTDALRAYSSETAALLWTGLIDEGIGSGPSVANGIVYVHSDAGILYAFDAGGCGQETCSPLWEGLTEIQLVGDGRQAPAIAEGMAYLGANSTFFAFPADGCGTYECAPLWTSTTACSFFSAKPSVANGVVYSVCGNSDIYAFDASTGDILWQYFTAGSGYPMRSSPVIVDGRLFHDATFDFTLYAFHVPGAGKLGGEVHGLKTVKFVHCVNRKTGQRVSFPLIGETTWDCRERGLEVESNDLIDMFIRAHAE